MTGPLVIAAERMLLPGGVWSGVGGVSVAGGRIVGMGGDGATVRLEGGVLTPGLLDLHNNGAFGVDFAEADAAAWRRVLQGLAARGVTSVLPTVITAPIENMVAALDRVAGVASGEGLARVLGAHLEGPFLAGPRRGAHRADWLRDATPAALDRLLGHRALRMVTLAPERAGGLAAIRQLTAAGVRVSMGHSDATAAQALEGAAAGATLVTHVFNAMRPFGHRDPGLPGVALTDARLWCCLIVDGQHVHPAACQVAFAAAGGRLVAVTDSIPIAGLPPGTTLPFGGAAVTMDPAGLGRRADGTISGAGIVLDEGVRRMITLGIDPAAVLRAATEAPAAAMGRDDLGRLAVGARADLVWWDAEWVPRRVWVRGEEVACG